MDKDSENFSITQITEEGRKNTEIAVAREYPLTLILNGQELVTLLCSPKELDYLAVGYLASEGFIKTKEEVKNVLVDEVRGVARVETTGEIEVTHDILFKRIITTGCGRGASFYSSVDVENRKVTSQMKIAASDIFELVMAFQHHSELYLSTHGVHSAALCDNKNILIFSDDIGRHNAVDRIFGRSIIEGTDNSDRIILTTGRVSSEIIHKIAKHGIPVIVSISSPTNLSVKIAENLGITLVGGVRGKRRMNIYANDWRII